MTHHDTTLDSAQTSLKTSALSTNEKHQIATHILAALPHCRLLNMSVEAITDTHLVMRLPYQQAIVGNPETGAVHGGSLTTLMDTASGAAAILALPEPGLCPTLDLRIDYMNAARAGEDLLAYACVSRVSSSVIFTECQVVQAHDETVVAKCSATFMQLEGEAARHARAAVAALRQSLNTRSGAPS